MQARDIDGQRRAGIGHDSGAHHRREPVRADAAQALDPQFVGAAVSHCAATPVFLGEVVPRHPVDVGGQRAWPRRPASSPPAPSACWRAAHARRRSAPPSARIRQVAQSDVTDARQRSVDTAQHVGDADVGGRPGEFVAAVTPAVAAHQPIGPQVGKNVDEELRRNALGLGSSSVLTRSPPEPRPTVTIARTAYSRFADIRMPRILPSDPAGNGSKTREPDRQHLAATVISALRAASTALGAPEVTRLVTASLPTGPDVMPGTRGRVRARLRSPSSCRSQAIGQVRHRRRRDDLRGVKHCRSPLNPVATKDFGLRRRAAPPGRAGVWAGTVSMDPAAPSGRPWRAVQRRR